MSNRSLAGVRTAVKRSWRSALVATLLVAPAGCGGSTTTPSPATLHAEVGDPAGDALPDASDRVSPDLVRGTVDVSAGTITFTFQFAPGTLDPSTARLTLDLDVDQNPSTGIRTADGLGVEYAVDMRGNASQASVLKAVSTGTCTATDACYLPQGMAPLSVLADRMTVTIPLALIGSADGRLNYRVRAYAFRLEAVSQVITDVMPDVAMAPAHVP